MFKKQRYVVRKISDFWDKDTRIQENTRASGRRGGVNFVVWVALWLCDTVANEMLNGGRKHPVACGTGTVADTKGLFYRLHEGCGCKKSPSEWAQWGPFDTLATACPR